MKQETITFEGFIFTVIYTENGYPQIYQDAKGYFGATWLSVNKLPEGKEGLLKVVNQKFGTNFTTTGDGFILHE